MNLTEEENPKESLIPKVDEDEYHIFLSYYDNGEDSKQDEEYAEKLKQKLINRGYKVWDGAAANHSIVQNIETGLKVCQKTIIILSRKYWDSHYKNVESAITMQNMIDKGHRKITIIPILFNPPDCKQPLQEWDIPARMSMLNYIHADKEHFDERLFLAINANKTLHDALPAGNVAYGLAWSYFYGYLNLILKDLPGRIKKCEKIWNQDPKQRKVACKMFLIIPKSCHCPPSFEYADKRITNFAELETYYASRAGNPLRPYPAYSKKITMENGEEYFFIGEFVTPILAMYEMEIEGICGLSQTEKYKQVTIFYNTLKEILNHPNAKHCHGKTVILFYNDEEVDGKKYQLADRLVESIKISIEDELESEHAGTAV